MKFRLWRMTSGTSDVIEYDKHPDCGHPDSHGWPCPSPAEFALTWAVNRSGLPGQAERETALVCEAHVTSRIATISFRYTTTVAVAPLKEIP